MRILILGGTRFLGRHLVEAARKRGHEVTLFNRGQSGPDLFPDVTQLRGNRDGDLASLQGKTWDAAIDTSGYFPRVVRASAELLSSAVGHYTFISSISVYADLSRAPITEGDQVGTLEDESVEQITGETYGPLKALCEQAVERALPGRTLVIRPGLIVGPHDPTDRFTYWPHRVAQGGDVLAPNGPDLPVQIIDARDLAEWNIRAVETGITGVFNATGPDYPLGLGNVLETSKRLSDSDARFVWVDEAFLLERDVKYWQDLPAVLPQGDPQYAGMTQVDCTKAIQAGLTFRPIEDTIRATLQWDATRPADTPLRAGLTHEREAELLRAWRERRL
ncbi:MAG TPA: NAD-dependent epimerase/dehydratase family protein [Chloroflexota bacterium]|nr:NAD-dependent epimerase/dehydratase family protein [Chloroflexota bacterium]